MILSDYLSHLIRNGMIEKEAAEIINRRFSTEEAQADKVKEYLEGKKRLLADLEGNAEERWRAMRVNLQPFQAYFDNEEFLKGYGDFLDGLPALLKKLESPCFLCGLPFEDPKEHPLGCLWFLAGVHLSSMLKNWETQGRATPQDKETHVALDNMMEEAGRKLDAVIGRGASARPKVEGSFTPSKNGRN
jgi:hypothetical protein